MFRVYDVRGTITFASISMLTKITRTTNHSSFKQSGRSFIVNRLKIIAVKQLTDPIECRKHVYIRGLSVYIRGLRTNLIALSEDIV